MKLLLAMLFILIVCTSAVPQGTRIVTAAEANGTYRYRRNEIKILALGHKRMLEKPQAKPRSKMTRLCLTRRILRNARLPSNFFGEIRSTSLRIIQSIAVLA